MPPIPGLDTVPYFTNESIFDLTKLPKHLVVVGGGPIGMEMAQAFVRLGAEVTVLEAFTAMGKDDPELAGRVVDAVRADGVALREGAKVTGVAKHGRAGIRVTIETKTGDETVEASDLLVAVGRAPVVGDLGLEEAGVAYERSGIKVDAKLRTTNRRIYAAGDIAGGYQFTHWAGYHAGLIIRSILFRFGGKVNNDLVTWATYTDPELAHVGLTEDQARQRHGNIRILRWPYAENDRAQAERAATGLVKVITTKKGGIVVSMWMRLWILAVGRLPSICLLN